MKRLILPLAAAAAIGGVAACGGGDGGPSVSGDADLTVYSGRNEKLVGDLIKLFEDSTKLDVEVRYGESAELAATIAEEGDRSPADVFFSQDAGALGAVEEAGLLQAVPPTTLDRVDERFRDPDGRWVGTSGRARVVAYSTERVQEEDLPGSIFEFTEPAWKGRIALPPTNASFQAFISGMRLAVGDERTREWLEGIKANDPVVTENNIQAEEAIASGEVDVAFVNHYYLGELKEEKPGFPVENHFLEDGDPGSLINAAGVGILAGSDSLPAARRFVDFLLSEEGQRYFVEETFEYPLVDGVAQPAGTKPLDEVQGPDIALGELGEQLRSTVELINDVGFTS